MKKNIIESTGFRIAVLLLGVFLLGVFLFWNDPSAWTLMTKTITQQQAIKEMPYITITDEDFLLLQTIRQDEDIKKALQDGEITDFIIEKGNTLAREMLPEDIQKGTMYTNNVFSILDPNAICIDYVSNDHRIILILRENDVTTKLVHKYPQNGRYVETGYSNLDNKEYRKISEVPKFWDNIFGDDNGKYIGWKWE